MIEGIFPDILLQAPQIGLEECADCCRIGSLVQLKVLRLWELVNPKPRLDFWASLSPN